MDKRSNLLLVVGVTVIFSLGPAAFVGAAQLDKDSIWAFPLLVVGVAGCLIGCLCLILYWRLPTTGMPHNSTLAEDRGANKQMNALIRKQYKDLKKRQQERAKDWKATWRLIEPAKCVLLDIVGDTAIPRKLACVVSGPDGTLVWADNPISLAREDLRVAARLSYPKSFPDVPRERWPLSPGEYKIQWVEVTREGRERLADASFHVLPTGEFQ